MRERNSNRFLAFSPCGGRARWDSHMMWGLGWVHERPGQKGGLQGLPLPGGAVWRVHDQCHAFAPSSSRMAGRFFIFLHLFHNLPQRNVHAVVFSFFIFCCWRSYYFLGASTVVKCPRSQPVIFLYLSVCKVSFLSGCFPEFFFITGLSSLTKCTLI